MDLRGGGGALEPGGGTPGILIRHGHEGVMDGVLMDVVQPREVGALVGEAGVPVVVPDLASGCGVEAVDPVGGGAVQFLEHKDLSIF